VIRADAREEFRLNEGDKVVIMKAPMHEGLMVLKAEVLVSRV
jgi:hypothetical protein